MTALRIAKLYFAHAMTDYDNERERKALHLIKITFPDWEVINPNTMQHATVANGYKFAGQNAMDYFCAIVRSCDAVVYLPTEAGEIGPGVAKEIIEGFCFEKGMYMVNFERQRIDRKLSPGHVFEATYMIPVPEMRKRIVAMKEGKAA